MKTMFYSSLCVLVLSLFCMPSAADPRSNPPTLTIVQSFPDIGPDYPGLAWDGTSLWMTQDSSVDDLVQIDPLTGAEIGRCGLYGGPHGLAFDGARFWVDFDEGYSIHAFSGDCEEEYQALIEFDCEFGLTWDGAYLWGAFGRENCEIKALIQYDPWSGTVIQHIDLTEHGITPADLAFDGRYLWVADPGHDAIHLFDPDSGDLLHTIPAPLENPTALTWDGSSLWCGFGLNGGQSCTLARMNVDFPSTHLADLTCIPAVGILPFRAWFSAGLRNNTTENRRVAATIDITTGDGSLISNWRSGYTNLSSEESVLFQWSLIIPRIASLEGDNLFTMTSEDVTPAPYNQPPNAPSGDTWSDTCTIQALAAGDGNSSLWVGYSPESTKWPEAAHEFALASVPLAGYTGGLDELDASSLAGFSMLFLNNSTQVWTQSCPGESCLSAVGAQDIVDWVTAGNSLFVTARANPYEELFGLIGVTAIGGDGGSSGFDWPITEKYVTVTGAHPITEGVTTLHGDVGALLALDGNWTVLSANGNEIYLAVREMGAGRIVIWWAQRSFRAPGPSGNVYESDIDEADNRAFLINLIEWLR